MGWRDRFGLRRARRRGGPGTNRFDRPAEDADLQALVDFAKSRVGVEFYVEPETFATGTTAVAVATDGEWIRRRAGSPEVVRKLARKLAVPAYDVQIVGYPKRMRDWTARNKRGLSLEDGA
ncbi:hypothetical protein ACQEU5_15940 [Marinactinospora thermotolerans]|uniref:Uncharacterized protein n=1 Tax=Marinactinospora thermotolerans DSM 45154 TaxID=1122192 RepID=A0A1T4SNE3_9ACTN|nr:hypothetical protein [Marinactinospora thermotolerans]SKA29707.1 hypothetical protein SAMN02745673_03757 [Marinactinospora thermotolerans DSM 45154]